MLEHVVLDREGFAAVLRALVETGHDLVGPTVRDGAIVLDTLRGIDELPDGVGDEQAPRAPSVAATRRRRRHPVMPCTRCGSTDGEELGPTGLWLDSIDVAGGDIAGDS